MSSYVYLVNYDERIYVEAYRTSSCGETIEEGEKLTNFIEYCRLNNLTMNVIPESMFEELEVDDFKELEEK